MGVCRPGEPGRGGRAALARRVAPGPAVLDGPLRDLAGGGGSAQDAPEQGRVVTEPTQSPRVDAADLLPDASQLPEGEVAEVCWSFERGDVERFVVRDGAWVKLS